MIPGFNHTVMHHGTAYHVQTEDSGLQNPIISTHLFLGGNVLASRRTSYADLVGGPDLEDVVRRLMQEQHKDMLRQLVRGAFDGKPDSAAGRAYQPGQLAETPEALQPRPEPEQPPQQQLPPAAPPPARSAGRGDAPPVLPRVARPQAAAPVLIPEIEDEDLMSDRRLDEVILAYLAEAPGVKRGP